MSKAFTLIEFLVTLAVAAILLVIAVPGFNSFLQNNKIAANTNKLSASFNLARMEAIKRGLSIGVCASNSAANQCGSDWSQGWLIFVDRNNDNKIDAYSDIIKIEDNVSKGLNIRATNNIVIYENTGFASQFSVTISALGCSGKKARRLNIIASGNLSLEQVSC